MLSLATSITLFKESTLQGVNILASLYRLNRSENIQKAPKASQLVKPHTFRHRKHTCPSNAEKSSQSLARSPPTILSLVFRYVEPKTRLREIPLRLTSLFGSDANDYDKYCIAGRRSHKGARKRVEQRVSIRRVCNSNGPSCRTSAIQPRPRKRFRTLGRTKHAKGNLGILANRRRGRNHLEPKLLGIQRPPNPPTRPPRRLDNLYASPAPNIWKILLWESHCHQPDFGDDARSSGWGTRGRKGCCEMGERALYEYDDDDGV